MQDRFKFRAWDSDESKYATDDDICFDTGGECECVYDLLKVNDSFYVIEQCTGLKDKNGKLIYEDDIVRLQLSYDENLSVEYSEGSFNLVGNYGFRTLLRIYKNDCEVVGNIHENPELLEED